MKVVITINTDNAAFDDPGELPRIIRVAADLVTRNRLDRPLLDVNGNTVGHITTED
jgi:hypothetical protein